MTEQSPKFETLAIHAGQSPDPTTGSRALPIHQTTSFVFPSAQAAADRFSLAELGPIYTRLNNPTTEVVENRVAALEGGVAALMVASGQSAITLSILTLAQAGDSIVVSPSLYGGSYNLFKHTLPRLGIEASWVEDPDSLDSWKAAVRPNTKAFFAESIPNPRQDVLDVEGVSAIAHDAGVPLIVDNTIASPFLLRPLEYGADIVVHSATKFLGGHGTAIGGVIVDGGRFDFGADPKKFPLFNEPDPSYNGIVYSQIAPALPPYAIRARVSLLRDLGPAISPHNAFLIAQGIETLHLRMERHVENTKKVADYLVGKPGVASVAYAGLPDSPFYDRAQKYLPRGAGSVLGFVLEGGVEAGTAFVDALELHSNVANVGDVRSLVIHPASTTHSQLSEDEQKAAGVEPGFVRLSVGLEHIDDILADLDRGFAAIAA
ncbi:bifunctional o-acetylhomoserine/o-acetylserine sulfhydrylase [Brachybacterium alimentarium]|uniref:bifunctional o-acetylhomoserine/o-acetylserine sulfhydrylase n=1 Tax=Brachybacterium alimentarium TaxID=47845 RepID=UPI000DF35A56|nr:bifunctional o-acetylhomoserine/o-acetylserine sulfhydrylase [Brachybacterium alimentarium]RCS69333.1 bifunctional o-acetylhomoserine/o-acetylserine sulfhydrylase [Brachybacterium alimentarium]RCS76848.1 bifunctional o-acetylhomoserine/o-acetylserine sulfhydrylase [Brachybacterium alimentarium]RCS91162.1 bifunctional o-acetylhomoserine/o-acetylserine sulfhydrylase [Brachybacterium alimentarium]